ncbi:sensor histidine kinase [Sphaerotilus sp.]|uniref:sensor histidine kinase n=1 Tax=Sphaerotilus sp. TaxID=2093942 RepID=UPI002ACE2A26|nr:histidine kinase [Sphaerotilus sp.]MDZ7855351.1 histidine kinase [Sphaerotilus sp.]
MPTRPPARTTALRDWHSTVLRRIALTLGLAVLISLALTLASHGRFVDNLVYSLAIGLLCELMLDGGRRGIAWVLHRRAPDNLAAGQGWPGWGWMGVCIVVGVPVAYLGGHALGDWVTGYRSSLGNWRPNMAMLMVSLSLGLGATFFFKSQGELAATRAEAESALRMAAEHRLKLLESQLEPHMLFNTLANLRVLIALDPPQAQAMLDHLIAFLRSTLQGSRTTLHPLQVEFERLRDYLALMSVRMGPRLQTHLDLPPELADVAVPTLLLQPLVENAIRHGLEPALDGGQVRIEARRVDRPEGMRLQLRVFDSGDGPFNAGAPPPGTGTGFGLTQVRERLLTLYGAEATLTLSRTDSANGPPGTLALIDLPLLSPTTP